MRDHDTVMETVLASVCVLAGAASMLPNSPSQLIGGLSIGIGGYILAAELKESIKR